MCAGSQEAFNKIDRRNRVFHARKTSRVDNLTDVVHCHMESSDPLVIANMRFPKKKPSPPTPAMAALLMADDESTSPSTDKDDVNDSDSDSDSDFEL